MHLGGFLTSLAASAKLLTPLSPRGEEAQCLEDCVRTTIKPFVMAASDEGFRQALGAHNTLDTCMWTEDCRDTVQMFIEEVAEMVLMDRLQRRPGQTPNDPRDGYTGGNCSEKCLVRTARTAAGQAGIVAMAVGQKHFYSNDSFYNRWSPRQMLELDQAMRQLKGRNLAEVAYNFKEYCVDCKDVVHHLEYDRSERKWKFDLAAFRYNGTAEIPLLHRPRISRAMARKILSHIPVWGADPKGASNDTHAWPWADKRIHARDSILPMGLKNCSEFKNFGEDVQKIMQNAYDLIHNITATSKVDGFTYFLYHQRLYQNATNETVPLLPGESWDRVLGDIDTPSRITVPQPEYLEDLDQASNWVWQLHAYGVSNDSRPIPPLRPGWEGPKSTQHKDQLIEESMNVEHGPRLTQWVTDSVFEPLKGVEESGYTHQPWTTPWFWEYPHNLTDTNATLIRGYTFELTMSKPAFREDSAYYFRDTAFNASTGAVKDFSMIEPWDRFDDGWPYVTAITGDGRAFRRQLSDKYVLTADHKKINDILTADGQPLYTENDEQIKLVYDLKTGLAETKYGRAWDKPLDHFMGDF